MENKNNSVNGGKEYSKMCDMEMVQPELRDLLNNGMITLIEVKQVIRDGMPKYKEME